MCYRIWQRTGRYQEAARKAWKLANEKFLYSEAAKIYESMREKPFPESIKVKDGVKSDCVWWLYNLESAINTVPGSVWTYACEHRIPDISEEKFTRWVVKLCEEKLGGQWAYYWEY